MTRVNALFTMDIKSVKDLDIVAKEKNTGKELKVHYEIDKVAESVTISFTPENSGTVTLEGFVKGNSIGNSILLEVKKTPVVEYDILPTESAVVGIPVTFKLKPNSEDPDTAIDVKVLKSNGKEIPRTITKDGEVTFLPLTAGVVTITCLADGVTLGMSGTLVCFNFQNRPDLFRLRSFLGLKYWAHRVALRIQERASPSKSKVFPFLPRALS